MHKSTQSAALIIAMFGVLGLTACAGSDPEDKPSQSATSKPSPRSTATESSQASPAPTVAPPPAPAPAPAPEQPAPTVATITFFGSDIQVVGATYDDTPATEDLGRVVGPYSITVPLGVGFNWGAVAFNGANDAGCQVTVGDRVVIDNTAPNQMSAICSDFQGVE